MDKYEPEYLAAHDIDWFCYINCRPIHAASNGGTLPSIINNSLQNTINQKLVYSLHYIYDLEEIEVNKKYINKLFATKDRGRSGFDLITMQNNYLRAFIDMARRGLYSFDRQYYNIYRSNKYIPIAWPKNYDETIRIKLESDYFIVEGIDFSKLNTVRGINFGKMWRV